MTLFAQQLPLITEPMHYHDTSAWGFFSLLTKNGSSKPSQRSYSLERLPWVIENVNPALDTYVSQAEFIRPNRRTVNVARLPLMFADIDPTAYNRHLPPSEWQRLALMACVDEGIPPPSLIVFSGRGIHLKWILSNPVPRAALPRWTALQQEIGNRLAGIGADPQARDASRVLRLEQTVNSKTGEVCRLLWMDEEAPGVPRRHDFDMLFDELMPLTRAELDAKRQHRAQVQERRQAMRVVGGSSTPTGAQVGFNGRRLAWDRLEDLRRLAALRGGVDEGWRMLFLHWSANFAALSGTMLARDFWREVDALAREISPDWRWDRSDLSTLHQKAQAFASGERVEFAGREWPALYTPRNDTLVNMLAITDNEQRQLRTIMSKAEAARRDAERKMKARRAGGVVERSEYEAGAQHRREVAKALRAAGASNAEIAANLSVHVKSVPRLLK